MSLSHRAGTHAWHRAGGSIGIPRSAFCECQQGVSGQSGGLVSDQPTASIAPNKPHEPTLDVDLIRAEDASLVVRVRSFQRDS